MPCFCWRSTGGAAKPRSSRGCPLLHAGHAVSLTGEPLLGEERRDTPHQVTRLGGKLAKLTLPTKRGKGLLRGILLLLAEQVSDRELWHRLLLPAEIGLELRLAHDWQHSRQNLRGLEQILRDMGLPIRRCDRRADRHGVLAEELSERDELRRSITALIGTAYWRRS
jgi:hypothetical protein